MAAKRAMPRNCDRDCNGIEPCVGWRSLRESTFNLTMLQELLRIIDIVFFDGTFQDLVAALPVQVHTLPLLASKMTGRSHLKNYYCQCSDLDLLIFLLAYRTTISQRNCALHYRCF